MHDGRVGLVRSLQALTRRAALPSGIPVLESPVAGVSAGVDRAQLLVSYAEFDELPETPSPGGLAEPYSSAKWLGGSRIRVVAPAGAGRGDGIHSDEIHNKAGRR